MLANQDTILVGSKVVLVPYASHHVKNYHAWMQDDELRSLTASEPLTLQEEFEMQRKWREDEDKLTFIILARDPLRRPPNIQQSNVDAESVIRLPMIGDVNLFLKGIAPHLRQQCVPDGASYVRPHVDLEDEFEAEVEVMIAESQYRRHGYATEALRLFLQYATSTTRPAFSLVRPHSRSTEDVPDDYRSPLPIPSSSLVVRVGQSNAPSISLFRRLGFNVRRIVTVFEEVEMRYEGTGMFIQEAA